MVLHASLSPVAYLATKKMMRGRASRPTAISVFVGIDRPDAKHDICLLLLGEEDGGTCTLKTRPSALHDWVLKLIEEFGTRGSIYVATEKARGALLYTLMQYPQLRLFPPQLEATGKLRETPRASGTKNDRWHCRLQAELVKHFHDLGSAIASADHVLPEESRPGLASLARSLPISQRFSHAFCSVFGEQYLSP